MRNLSMSSPRKRGPITTDACCRQNCGPSFAQHGHWWLWVPARASLGRDDDGESDSIFRIAYPRHPEEHRESDASRRTTARAAHPSRLAQRCKCTARLAPPATTAKPLRGDDGLRYTSAISRRDVPEFCKNRFAALNNRGRGECRVPNAPAASCVIKNTRVSHHRYTGTPGIPARNGFTAYFALSPATRLV